MNNFQEKIGKINNNDTYKIEYNGKSTEIKGEKLKLKIIAGLIDVNSIDSLNASKEVKTPISQPKKDTKNGNL